MMDQSPETVTISIIIHEDFSHIYRALYSITSKTTLPLDIYLTINRGDDAQVEQLQREFPQINVLRNSEPKGFATNHNRILQLATTDYVVLMNDDVEAVPHLIDTLVRFMEERKEVGLVSPQVLNPDGTPQLMAFSDPTLIRMLYKVSGLGHFTRQGSILRQSIMSSPVKRLFRTASLQTYKENQIVPVVVGVVMCVRQTAYRQSGMMDEDTLVYGEEYGWHWKLRQRGWKIALCVETAVTHFNIEQPISGWKLSEHRKGMLNFFIRYRPSWQASIMRVSIIILHSVRASLALLVSRQQAAAEWSTVVGVLKFQPKHEFGGYAP